MPMTNTDTEYEFLTEEGRTVGPIRDGYLPDARAFAQAEVPTQKIVGFRFVGEARWNVYLSTGGYAS
jgi:hypothetical protein